MTSHPTALRRVVLLTVAWLLMACSLPSRASFVFDDLLGGNPVLAHSAVGGQTTIFNANFVDTGYLRVFASDGTTGIADVLLSNLLPLVTDLSLPPDGAARVATEASQPRAEPLLGQFVLDSSGNGSFNYETALIGRTLDALLDLDVRIILTARTLTGGGAIPINGSLDVVFLKVPEPATLGLVAFAALAAAAYRRRPASPSRAAV